MKAFISTFHHNIWTKQHQQHHCHHHHNHHRCRTHHSLTNCTAQGYNHLFFAPFLRRRPRKQSKIVCSALLLLYALTIELIECTEVKMQIAGLQWLSHKQICLPCQSCVTVWLATDAGQCQLPKPVTLNVQFWWKSLPHQHNCNFLWVFSAKDVLLILQLSTKIMSLFCKSHYRSHPSFVTLHWSMCNRVLPLRHPDRLFNHFRITKFK